MATTTSTERANKKKKQKNGGFFFFSFICTENATLYAAKYVLRAGRCRNRPIKRQVNESRRSWADLQKTWRLPNYPSLQRSRI